MQVTLEIKIEVNSEKDAHHWMEFLADEMSQCQADSGYLSELIKFKIMDAQ